MNDLRSEHQQVQRSQFDAEKKVAVADTSIQNLQRTIQQMEEEQTASRQISVSNWTDEQNVKEEELEIKKT